MRKKVISLLVASVGVGFAIASACTHAPAVSSNANPTLIFETGDSTIETFFNAPFPADARLDAAGHPAVAELPNPGGIAFVDAASALVQREVDGFDPSGAIYFRFDRPLPFASDVVFDSQRDLQGVWILDIDPTSPEYGQRIPALVRLTSHHDGVRPANLFQVLPVPGRGGVEGKTHAVVLERDLNRDKTIDLGPSPVVARLLSTSPGAGEERWHASMTPLRAFLASDAKPQALTSENIAAATVYTHGAPTARLFDWVRRALDAQAPALASPLVVERTYADYVVVTGALKMPMYQQGTPPHFFGEGDIAVDATGGPIVQTHVVAPFVLTIPTDRDRAAPVPLYFYIHGTGGLSTQAIDRGYRATTDAVAEPGSGLGRWVAADGLATSCIAGPYSPERIGWRALDGYGAYVFFNPKAMRDNFSQMLLEQAHFLKFLSTLQLDPVQLGAAEHLGPERVTFRPSVVGGQSLGSYLSGMFAVLSGAFDGAILTGAGGSWIEFGFGPKNPVDLARVLDVVAAPKGEQLDRFHPFITLFQTAVGPADNTHYTPYLHRRRPPRRHGEKTPHLLVIEGEDDLQVPVHLQRALVLSAGPDLVGDDVGETADRRLAPSLRFGGLQTVTQAQGNRKVFNNQSRTSGVVRYLEDGILEGHYVVFQRPDATAQLKRFAAAVARGDVPTVRAPIRAAPAAKELLSGIPRPASPESERDVDE